MVSHNLSKILSSPFVVIDDKGGEVIHKDDRIDKGGEFDNPRGSIKI